DILQAEQQIASVACIKIGEKLRVPVIADFHGIWAEEMVASNIIDYDDACYKTLFELEQEIACSADAVTVVSEEMKDYVESSFGASSNKVVLIPNATFPRVDGAKIVRKPSKVIHSGTLHPWENVELFVEAMPIVLKRYPSAKFYLTRKGAKLNKIKRLAHGLRVFPEFIWFDSGSDFFEFLKSCDVGVISSTTHIARKMAYPAKLYDYLSVGLPIVANDIGAWTRIIRENRVGIVTDNSPEAFAGGILELLENPKLLYECEQRGIELVKRELNYYRSAEKLLGLYERLA
ncbi:MAG: glycosyltransferase, partial [Candidatus Baldrarchaeia archaeon]